MDATRDMVVKLLEPQDDGSLAVMVRTYRWEQPTYIGKSGPPLIGEKKIAVRPAHEGEPFEEYYHPQTLRKVRVAPCD